MNKCIYFKPEIEKKGLQLSQKTGLPGKKAYARTDREKLYSIFSTLIEVAIKNTSKETIEFGYQLKDKHIEFYVKDSGKEIPKELHKSVFDPLAGHQYKKTPNKSGIELSIAKTYVEMLGGKIWLENGSNKGKTIYFSIPYTPVEKDYANTDKVIFDSDYNWQGKSILIMEDNPKNREYIKEILEPTNIKLYFAENGKEALREILIIRSLDIILADIRLPGMTGLEVIQELRKTNNLTPVIALTAYGLSEDRTRCIRAGANDYVAKPFSMNSLLEKIDHIFRSYRLN